MKNNSLQLDGLSIARDGMVLIPEINCQLQAGELLAVYGSNGVGKSTLLRSIAGLHRLAAGDVRWNGEPLDEVDFKPLYLGHRRGLHASLTVAENVRLWAEASGAPELFPVAMHYFDLEDLAEVPVNHLSAGWQQRVALTRLLTMVSPLWLLDEPASNLDAQGVSLLQSLIQTRLERGGIIIVATHHPMQGDFIKTININDINKNINVVNEC